MDRAEATSVLRWGQRPDRSSCLLQALRRSLRDTGRGYDRTPENESGVSLRLCRLATGYASLGQGTEPGSRPVRTTMSSAAGCRGRVTRRRETPDSLSVAAG